MNKILKFFKRRFLCNSDSDLHDLPQFSPRTDGSKSKKRQQKKTNNEIEKSSRYRKSKGKRKKRGASEESNSVHVSRGSTGSVSALQTPNTFEKCLTKENFGGLLTSGNGLTLNPPPSPVGLSPPVKTLSADTPERTIHFQKKIENVIKNKFRILGKGSFGTVIQATYKGELVAVKIVPPCKSNSLKNELNNFLLSHPNIVKTLRIISDEEDNSYGYVVMEMFSPFTLDHLANQDSYKLDEISIVRFMIDIGHALNYCHSRRVLHLDVKPQNILVNVRANSCKLCDFGSSCLLKSENMVLENTDFKALQSTVVYASPELLMGNSPSEKSDVYSFGITLWQLIHNEKPYVVDNEIDLQSTIYKIVKQNMRPRKKSSKSGKLGKLYMSCWDHDPERRPTIQEVTSQLQSFQALFSPS